MKIDMAMDQYAVHFSYAVINPFHQTSPMGNLPQLRRPGCLVPKWTTTSAPWSWTVRPCAGPWNSCAATAASLLGHQPHHVVIYDWLANIACNTITSSTRFKGAKENIRSWRDVTSWYFLLNQLLGTVSIYIERERDPHDYGDGLLQSAFDLVAPVSQVNIFGEGTCSELR